MSCLAVLLAPAAVGKVPQAMLEEAVPMVVVPLSLESGELVATPAKVTVKDVPTAADIATWLKIATKVWPVMPAVPETVTVWVPTAAGLVILPVLTVKDLAPAVALAQVVKVTVLLAPAMV